MSESGKRSTEEAPSVERKRARSNSVVGSAPVLEKEPTKELTIVEDSKPTSQANEIETTSTTKTEVDLTPGASSEAKPESETKTPEDVTPEVKEKPKHTFGGNPFLQIKKTSVSPPVADGSKPVFGTASSFGGNKVTPIGKKVEEKGAASASISSPTTTTTETASPSGSSTVGETSNAPVDAVTTTSTTTKVSTSTTPSFGSFGSFGSNSKFGNAFQKSLKKKSFLDEASEPEDKDKDKADAPEAEAVPEKESIKASTPQYKQVDLTPVSLTTGEENEKSHFNATAKIFSLDLTKMSEGWKERGVGPLHLNQSLTDAHQVRLVMRSQGLLRVVLNMKITRDTVAMKGLEASLSPGKYVRFNSISEDGVPMQYLLKFGTQVTRDTLYDKIEELKKGL
ncbi:ran-specific GTPase-activating protein 2 [[Candida] anglica]|uniref:Ran-specific GTPase-activating protein 2 n=1 Tax=[Candida] anglica TaxID=148631 RepID=A0ABP0EGW7_9ASCO